MPVTFPLFSCGHELDTSSNAFGAIASSADCLGDVDELRRELIRNGANI